MHKMESTARNIQHFNPTAYTLNTIKFWLISPKLNDKQASVYNVKGFWMGLTEER